MEFDGRFMPLEDTLESYVRVNVPRVERKSRKSEGHAAKDNEDLMMGFLS
jgi:hypothetical protein